MDSEILEHELAKMNGKQVTIVRPFFGNQSDSWGGEFEVIKLMYPLKFHFVGNQFSILFEASDVDYVQSDKNIIRLKGPSQYAPQSVSTIA